MLKKLGFYLALLIFVFPINTYAGKAELTTYYPAPSGEYSSLNATSSFIPPKMNTTQRNAITSASNPPLAEGMVIFNTDTGIKQLEVYDGNNWVPAGKSSVVANGSRNGPSVDSISTTVDGNLFASPPTITVPAGKTYTLIASASAKWTNDAAGDMWCQTGITVTPGSATTRNVASRNFSATLNDQLYCNVSHIQVLDGGASGTAYTINAWTYKETTNLSFVFLKLNYTVLEN